MKAETRRVLDIIDAELSKGNTELWNILTGTRGPDHEEDSQIAEEVKRDEKTTSHFRSHLGTAFVALDLDYGD